MFISISDFYRPRISKTRGLLQFFVTSKAKMMSFTNAISICLSKYGTFKGRATRSEFWWFYLFLILLSWGSSIAGGAVLGQSGASISSNIIALVSFVPMLAAGSRRLHDIGKSGWWQLLMLTVIGIILLVVWWASDTRSESNERGVGVPVSAPRSMANDVETGGLWFYEQGGQRKGPVAERDVPSLINEGGIAYGTLVWKNGLTDWVKFEESELKTYIAKNLPPPIPIGSK